MKKKLLMRKKFFLWFLPLFFAVCSLISFAYPGDEYALWGVSSIAGTWIWFIFPAGDIHNPLIPILVAITGSLVMAGFGLLLTALRANVKLWIFLLIVSFTAIFLCTVASYPTIEKALSKNGSWLAYIFASLNIGLYTSVVLAALISLFLIVFKKFKTCVNLYL